MRLRQKVQDRVGQSFGTDLNKGQLGLKRAFNLFQPDPETNEITRDAFRRLMTSMGFTVKDALALFQKFDRNQNGSLDMDEFARALLGKDESYDARPAMREKAASVYSKNLRSYLENPHLSDFDRRAAVKDVVRDQCIQRGSLQLEVAEQRLRDKVLQRIGNLHNNAVGQLGLKRAFLIFDPQDLGVITPDNFVKVLGNLGFAQKDAALIFQKYDENKNGSIDVREFQRLLMKPAAPAYSTLAMAEAKMKAKRDATMQLTRSMGTQPFQRLPVSQVQERLRDKLEQRVGNLWNRNVGQLGEERAFSLFNPREGRIYPEEFCKVLESYGFCREDALGLFQKADSNNSGGLDLSEFKEMLFGKRVLPARRPVSCVQPGARPPDVLAAWGAGSSKGSLSRPRSQAGPRPMSRTSQKSGKIMRPRTRAASAMSSLSQGL